MDVSMVEDENLVSSDDDAGGDDSSAVRCAVCHEAMAGDGPHAICVLPCGHYYGRSCVAKYFAVDRVRECVVCKRVVDRGDAKAVYVDPTAIQPTQKQLSVAGQIRRAERRKRKLAAPAAVLPEKRRKQTLLRQHLHLEQLHKTLRPRLVGVTSSHTATFAPRFQSDMIKRCTAGLPHASAHADCAGPYVVLYGTRAHSSVRGGGVSDEPADGSPVVAQFPVGRGDAAAVDVGLTQQPSWSGSSFADWDGGASSSATQRVPSFTGGGDAGLPLADDGPEHGRSVLRVDATGGGPGVTTGASCETRGGGATAAAGSEGVEGTNHAPSGGGGASGSLTSPTPEPPSSSSSPPPGPQTGATGGAGASGPCVTVLTLHPATAALRAMKSYPCNAHAARAGAAGIHLLASADRVLLLDARPDAPGGAGAVHVVVEGVRATSLEWGFELVDVSEPGKPVVENAGAPSPGERSQEGNVEGRTLRAPPLPAPCCPPWLPACHVRDARGVAESEEVVDRNAHPPQHTRPPAAGQTGHPLEWQAITAAARRAFGGTQFAVGDVSGRLRVYDLRVVDGSDTETYRARCVADVDVGAGAVMGLRGQSVPVPQPDAGEAKRGATPEAEVTVLLASSASGVAVIRGDGRVTPCLPYMSGFNGVAALTTHAFAVRHTSPAAAAQLEQLYVYRVAHDRTLFHAAIPVYRGGVDDTVVDDDTHGGPGEELPPTTTADLCVLALADLCPTPAANPTAYAVATGGSLYTGLLARPDTTQMVVRRQRPVVALAWGGGDDGAALRLVVVTARDVSVYTHAGGASAADEDEDVL